MERTITWKSSSAFPGHFARNASLSISICIIFHKWVEHACSAYSLSAQVIGRSVVRIKAHRVFTVSAAYTCEPPGGLAFFAGQEIVGCKQRRSHMHA
eukprot:839451-Pelagomonas_calceolata.AAC.6